jgi:tetratricopeptide (TPR) repeat protein
MSLEDRADELFWRSMEEEKCDQISKSFASLRLCLEIEPNHVLALGSIGELCLLYNSELGLDQHNACEQALNYFDRGLAVDPQNADLWSGRALSLLYADRPGEALASAERGLNCLPLCKGYAMRSTEVSANVMEALYDRKVSALYDLGRLAEAFVVLSKALEMCPKSKYLSRLIPMIAGDVLPKQDS